VLLTLTTNEGMKNPTYRVISVDKYIENKTAKTIRDLGMDHPSYEKGDLGEFSMDLFMLRHGYIKYSSKYGEQGFDGVYASPDGSIVYLNDSKWYETSHDLGKIMSNSLSNEQIENRTKEMSSRISKYPEFKATLDVLQNPNAKFYRAIYFLTDNGKRVRFLQEDISHNNSNLKPAPIKQKNYSKLQYSQDIISAREKIDLLNNILKSQEKVAKALAPYCKGYKLSQPRISEFLRGATSQKLSAAIEIAVKSYEEVEGEIVGS
jgi:hypothetical protein